MRQLLLLLVLTTAAWSQTLRVFVVTGQSNALGTLAATDVTMVRGGPGAHPAEQAGGVPFFWDNRADGTEAGDEGLGDSGGVWVEVGPQTGGYYPGNDDHWGPEVGFARMLWNAGYRDFALVKAARGGGGNSYWVKGAADDHMYRHVLTTVEAAVAELPTGYTTHEVAGLLYVQGESNDSTEADEAGSRFEALLANLRSDLPNAAGMAGILGEIGGGSTSNRNLTRSRQQAAAAGRPDIGYASAAGLRQHDGLHYDADSMLLLGERIAAEAIGAGSTGGEPLPAWSSLHAWMVADNGCWPGADGTVDRWASLHDGAALRDLTRSVGGRPRPAAATSGSGQPREVMRFDGTTDLWASSAEFGSLDGGRSVAVLCRVTAEPDGFLFDGSTFSGRTRAQVRGGDWQAGVSTSDWDVPEPATAPRVADRWQRHVFTSSGNDGPTTIEHWIDGKLAATATDPDSGSLRGLIVGSNGGNPFRHLAADIAEVAVFDRVLDAAEVGALDAAWQARWGTPGGPPFAVSIRQSPATEPRFGWHPLLEVRVDSPAAGTTVESLTFQMKGETRASVDSLRLVATGTSAHFDAGGPVAGELENPWSDTVRFNPATDLAEGTNHFWLAVRPQRWAELGTALDATVAELAFGGTNAGTVVPGDGDPPGELTLGIVPLVSDVRRGGDFGITTYRIPGIACDAGGVLHAVFDHRWSGGSDLPADIDVGYARSTDGGSTWSGFRPILDFDASVPGSSGNGVGDPCILWDPGTDTLWVAALWSFGNNGYNGSGPGTDPTETGQYVLTKSTDGGLSWSPPVNITADVKADPGWRLIFQGPGHGLAMRDGTLVFPSQYRDSGGIVRSCSVFSTDHGESWSFGSGVPTASPQTNENTVCELDDGRLLFSMRTPSGSNGQRAWIHYTPAGGSPLRDGSWSDLYRLPEVPDPVVQGSVIQWTSTLRGDPLERVLFANPASSSARMNLTLRVSGDGGLSWPVSRQVYAGPSAYSSLCILPDRSVGLLFEKDNYTRITFVRVEEQWLWNPGIDSDGDGMPDGWEILHGTDPAADDAHDDPDGDGRVNSAELAAGTDPRSRASVFRATSVAADSGGWTITWRSVPGRLYRVERSADLSAWMPAGEVVATGASASLTVADDRPRQFLRVRAAR